MKIGIVTEYFYPTLGGITENIYHFSRELLANGHEFRVITARGKDPGNIDEDVRKRMIFVGRSLPIFFNGSCGRFSIGTNLGAKLRDVFKSERFDIIHTHSPLFPTLPALADMYADAPVVGTFHTCTGGELFYYKLYRSKEQHLLDRMAGRIAVSECCARENELHFDTTFDVIPNGVDVDWWTSGKKIDRFNDGRINILFIGRPDKRNGLDTLISAFAMIHPLYPQTRLIVVGDGPLRFYFERLVPHGIRKAVHFEGAAGEGRPSYLNSAHIFCFTPSIASFGVTILEGMSAGAAMITSDIEAFRCLVKDGESALLVPPCDEGALARALKKLIEDQTLRTRIGTAARSAVAKYDWKNVAKTQIEYYNKIVKV